MSSCAIIFHRIGPYHFARVRAVGRNQPLVVIETSGADATYAWDPVYGKDGFDRITLFPDSDAQRRPAAEVAQCMARTLDKIRPSTVVIPGWSDPAALSALRWANGAGVPAIVMSETTEWDEPRKAWKEWMKRRVVQLFSAGLVGGTPHKDYLVRLGLPAECVFLGYDAVDNAYFGEAAKKIRDQRSGIRGQESGGGIFTPFFLASARFIEKKNLDGLIRAYARYRDLLAEQKNGKGVPWNLVLLGDGELRPHLVRLISELKLESSIQLPGFIQYDQLPEYYARASAFVHASTTEQWGLVVNEAMASELPVLVSRRCGCSQDLVRDGVNGFTFDPMDIEEMARIFCKISAPDFPVAEFGTASQKMIAEWGPDRFAKGLQSAVGAAHETGPVQATLTQRTVLAALLAR